MPPSPEAVRRYHRLLHTYRNRTSSGLMAAWRGLERYGEAEMDTFAIQARPVLSGAKTVTVATSSAFFAVALGSRPVGISADDVEVQPRITHPFLAMWHALKQGRPFEEALMVGESEAEAVGFDFVQSTSRITGDYVAEASGRRVRWQRIPGGSACEWCQEMAGQEYASAASADFGHARCDCVASPA